MAEKNYTQMATEIVQCVGGTENVKNLAHCMTRLRFTLKDDSKADRENIKKIDGVLQIVESGGQFQVVIGNQVTKVFDAAMQLPGMPNGEASSAPAPVEGEEEPKKKTSIGNMLIDTVTGVFTPVLTAMAAAGIVKGLVIALSAVGLLSTESGAYQILYAAADGFFTFLPVFLAYTSAEKFGANKFIAVAIACALVYPDLTAAYEAGTSLSFFGIPVVLISYQSTVLPIIVAVYVQSKLEKLLKKVLPEVVRNLLYPVFSLVIIVPATLLVIGPVTDVIGNTLANLCSAAMSVAPIPIGFILCFFWPLAIMAGLHWGFITIAMNNIALVGRDTLISLTGPLNFAQAGATLGVFLKTRNKDLKELSGQAFLSAFLAGITEPAMYGVTLKYKRPFYIVMLFAGIAGAIGAAFNVGTTAFASLSIFTWTVYIGEGFGAFIVACLVAFFGSMITTYLVGFNDSMLEGTK